MVNTGSTSARSENSKEGFDKGHREEEEATDPRPRWRNWSRRWIEPKAEKTVEPYLNFKCPLEKAAAAGYNRISESFSPVESQVLRRYRFTRVTSWKATRNKLFSSDVSCNLHDRNHRPSIDSPILVTAPTRLLLPVFSSYFL